MKRRLHPTLHNLNSSAWSKEATLRGRFASAQKGQGDGERHGRPPTLGDVAG